MIWLTTDMVVAFHRESLLRFGGSDGVRDSGLLESALARARNLHSYAPETDAFSLAASYCAGIVKNHPFVDGNKRTGVLSAVAFLALNGIAVEFEEVVIVTMIYGLAAGEISEDEIAMWLRKSLVSR